MSSSRKTKEGDVSITATEKFFLKMMRECSWASGAAGETSGDSLIFRGSEGIFCFIQTITISNAQYKPDPSRVNLSDKISILAKVDDEWLDVFVMTLGGHCREEDLTLLQAALMEAYAYDDKEHKKIGKFHGGRGLVHYPGGHTEKTYQSKYTNGAHGTFKNFGGTEGISTHVPGKAVSEFTGRTAYSGWYITTRAK